MKEEKFKYPFCSFPCFASIFSPRLRSVRFPFPFFPFCDAFPFFSALSARSFSLFARNDVLTKLFSHSLFAVSRSLFLSRQISAANARTRIETIGESFVGISREKTKIVSLKSNILRSSHCSFVTGSSAFDWLKQRDFFTSSIKSFFPSLLFGEQYFCIRVRGDRKQMGCVETSNALLVHFTVARNRKRAPNRKNDPRISRVYIFKKNPCFLRYSRFISVSIILFNFSVYVSNPVARMLAIKSNGNTSEYAGVQNASDASPYQKIYRLTRYSSFAGLR